ncbi:MAG: fimbrillin family protein, partial [Muribaculaceae bacterium]|nr:fimbrillin family protein [Muribaculaceae bacterium]
AEASASEGITTLPTAGAMSLDFVTPAEVADQFDLMYSTPRDASASPCKLTFNHALTAVRFVTGAEMTPCTISEIKISGVNSSATLNIESGEWSESNGQSEFAVEPGVALTAADGSKYVAAGTALTADNQTFFLLPQSLGSDAKISLTIEANGNTSTFEASLDGQTWIAGQTVTYRLSASAATPSLKLEICDADGKVIDKLLSKYTGSLLNYTVNSVYDDGNGNTQPVEWGMSFVDADGNALDSAPDWIVSYVSDGKGGESVELRTDLIVPTFLQMSSETQELRNATDINTASGYDYYNLSNATGAPEVENTANSYLINAPGKYSLPLVYGNAVKDGTTNQSAYVSTISDTKAHERKALITFINHLGNEISNPYIYNNSGCVPADAVLVWEEKIGLVRNVSLSDDKKSLEFEIPAGFIRQGNAEVAVRDKDGTIMWSWHIWVTNFVNGSDWYTVPVEGVDYHLYPHTMGRVNAGDITEFEKQEVVMRFTQKNVPDGLQALTIDLPVELASKTIETKSYYSFYQWGRKDPMVSAVDQFYDGEHNEIDAQQLPEHEFGTSHKEAIV